MRTIGEYLAKAAEFDELATTATHASLKKRYADLAECYRLLASERKRLIADGTLEVASEHGESSRLARLIESHEKALGLKSR